MLCPTKYLSETDEFPIGFEFFSRCFDFIDHVFGLVEVDGHFLTDKTYVYRIYAVDFGYGSFESGCAVCTIEIFDSYYFFHNFTPLAVTP